MDKLTKYRHVIKNLMYEYERYYSVDPTPGVDTILIMDEARDHYLLMRLGWTSKERVRHTTLHVRLHGGKIWVEEDWTEEGIATELLRAGVPREDVVLAFQPPSMRHLSEFAVA